MRNTKVMKGLPTAGKTDKDGRQRVFRLTAPQIRKYLVELERSGRDKTTVARYRAAANRFLSFLGEEQWVYADSLAQWKQFLIDSELKPRTINASITAVNTLLHYLGYRQLQYFDWLPIEDAQPEAQEEDGLSREEYLKLLGEAKRQENMQAYLIIKVLACTPLYITDLAKLTREGVEAGVLPGTALKGCGDIALPEALRLELREYAIYRGIHSGPIFLGVTGKPAHRSALYKVIITIAEAAGIPAGRATAMNLRRMYQQTMASFQAKADAWVERSYEALLQEEEAVCGWLMRVPQMQGAPSMER